MSFAVVGKFMVCEDCGIRIPIANNLFTADQYSCLCRSRHDTDSQPQIPPSGWGDYTEQLLESIGVTKDRYKAAKELFGLPPTCHCDQRKAWLNKVSDWWKGEH